MEENDQISDLAIVLIVGTFDGIITPIASESLSLDYLLGSLLIPSTLQLLQQYIQVERLAHIENILLSFNVEMQFTFNNDVINTMMLHVVYYVLFMVSVLYK